ncbi:hypothetical protein X975_25564, partial [Stegodyphus mimosarum]
MWVSISDVVQSMCKQLLLHLLLPQFAHFLREFEMISCLLQKLIQSIQDKVHRY